MSHSAPSSFSPLSTEPLLPPSSRPLRDLLDPELRKKRAQDFSNAVFHHEGLFYRLQYEAQELWQLLVDSDTVISQGRPESTPKDQWDDDWETLRDELDYQISLLMDKRNRLQLQVLNLHLERVHEEETLGEYADSEEVWTPDAQRFLKLGERIGVLGLRIESIMRKMWEELFGVKDGMFADELVPVATAEGKEGNQDAKEEAMEDNGSSGSTAAEGEKA